MCRSRSRRSARYTDYAVIACERQRGVVIPSERSESRDPLHYGELLRRDGGPSTRRRSLGMTKGHFAHSAGCASAAVASLARSLSLRAARSMLIAVYVTTTMTRTLTYAIGRFVNHFTASSTAGMPAIAMPIIAGE